MAPARQLLSQIQDADGIGDEHAWLRAFYTVKMRERAGLAREINTLIVGRVITGFSAFV